MDVMALDAEKGDETLAQLRSGQIFVPVLNFRARDIPALTGDRFDLSACTDGHFKQIRGW